MLRCMNSGISGMKVNQTKLDVIGNNIANVSTTAFKSSRAEFKDMLYQNAGNASSPTTVKGGVNAKQVGLGAQLSSINKLMTQGHALTTGRPLDVCIDGEGYFIVGKGVVDYSKDGNKINTGDHSFEINSNGGNNNFEEISAQDRESILDVLYTRDGNLTLDCQGNLLTADGYRVMGYLLSTDGGTTKSIIPNDDNNSDNNSGDSQKAQPLGKAQFVDADSKDLQAVGDTLQPLMIPDSVGGIPVKSFEIGKDGVIVAILGNGTRSALGQIAMATFKNPEGLTSVGGNLLQVSGNSGREIIRTGVGVNLEGSSEGSEDNSKGFGDMIQGALEGSNVDLTEQFTDMIVATRAFQASSKMITTGDEVLQTITNLIR